MKLKRNYLLLSAVIGGLLFSATMSTGKTYALSHNSSNHKNVQTTPTTATTTPPATTPDTTTTTTTTPDATTPASTDTTTTVTPTPIVTSTDTSTTTTEPTTTTPDDTTTPPAGNSSSDPSTNTGTITNEVLSTAQTGTATVSHSRRGGNAETGNATAVANLINTIQSTSSLNAANLQTFTDNIDGDHNGDIVVNPTYDLSNPNSLGQTTANLEDVVNNNGEIDNTVDLSATTGDATVENNKTAGNATTGNADTEANLINMINSMVSANQSYLGVINVNGNLNGNILIPADLVNTLLTDPSSLGPVNQNTAVTNTNDVTINNNVTLLAQSGNALVASDRNGGNATSGNATTDLNLYNLINSEIVGGNLLLVFVNVEGTWYGVLLSAPAGTTNAAIGGGISNYSILPTNTTTNTTINTTNNEIINNNLFLSATSGNALETFNGHGGNATTGNASSNADIVNIVGDQINLSGWLGILIINVFGNWTGSLEIQPTSNPSVPPVVIITSPQGSVKVSTTSYNKHVHYFSGQFNGNVSSSSTTSSSSPTASNTNGTTSHFASLPHITNIHDVKKSAGTSALGIIGFCFAAVMIGVERIVSFVARRG